MTPNWSVKPTAAIASTEAVTSPNPTEARKSATSPPPRGPARRSPGAHPASARSWAAVRFPTTFTAPDGL